MRSVLRAAMYAAFERRNSRNVKFNTIYAVSYFWHITKGCKISWTLSRWPSMSLSGFECGVSRCFLAELSRLSEIDYLAATLAKRCAKPTKENCVLRVKLLHSYA
jgi:hypothetical protein